jgi:hypothetical protein
LSSGQTLVKPEAASSSGGSRWRRCWGGSERRIDSTSASYTTLTKYIANSEVLNEVSQIILKIDFVFAIGTRIDSTLARSRHFRARDTSSEALPTHLTRDPD